MASDLAQLHDIHMPAPIGWWPLAPGWYLLAASLALVCFLMGFWLRRSYLNSRAKREALRALAVYQRQYQQDKNCQLTSAAMSELLKRVALAYYPRTRVAGLQGEPWIMFLSTTVKGVDFSSVRTLLLEGPYRPSRSHNLQPLFLIAHKWIKRQGRPCSN